MNFPAPAFGRGGRMIVALLAGLFIGSGLTWAVMSHRQAKAPLVVYQVLPHAPDKEGTPSLTPEDTPPESATPETEEPPTRSPSELVLHGHPKTDGCYANALAALAPFVKQGFGLRSKMWDGEVSLDEGKAVSCQLFQGNDYCFSVGTDTRGARLSLQLYTHDGDPTEAEQTAQATGDNGASATARLRCRQTGTYLVVVKLESPGPPDKAPWGMVSAYR